MDPITAALNLASEIIRLITALVDKTPSEVLNARIDKLFAFFDRLTEGLPPHLVSRLVAGMTTGRAEGDAAVTLPAPPPPSHPSRSPQSGGA